MEKLLDSIEAKLIELGIRDFQRKDDSISLPNGGEDGFSVHLWSDRPGVYIVNYGHYWHGHFETESDALDWFFAGVTGQARLVCTYHWRYLVRSVVEISVDDQWEKADTTGSCLGVLVWWLPKRTMILRNEIVQASE
jgi:hypothetical protein